MNNIKSIQSIAPVSQPVTSARKTVSNVSTNSTMVSSTNTEVNISKVAAMKAAIENGTFKINPEKIIDGMISKGDLVFSK